MMSPMHPAIVRSWLGPTVTVPIATVTNSVRPLVAHVGPCPRASNDRREQQLESSSSQGKPWGPAPNPSPPVHPSSALLQFTLVGPLPAILAQAARKPIGWAVTREGFGHGDQHACPVKAASDDSRGIDPLLHSPRLPPHHRCTWFGAPAALNTDRGRDPLASDQAETTRGDRRASPSQPRPSDPASGTAVPRGTRSAAAAC
jgi:hypothetical protein